MKKILLLVSLLLITPAYADMNEVDFNHLNIIKKLEVNPCLISDGDADQYTHLKRMGTNGEPYFTPSMVNHWYGDWNLVVKYISNNLFQYPEYGDYSFKTGFDGGSSDPNRPQWHNGGVLMQLGGNLHCQGFGMFFNTKNFNYTNHAGGGAGIGHRWQEEHPTYMTFPFSVTGRNVMVQVSDIVVPNVYVSPGLTDGDIQLDLYVFFYNPSTDEYVATVVTLYGNHTFTNCKENIGAYDAAGGGYPFNGTFLGSSSCSRQSIDIVTPSPYSSLSIFTGNPVTSPRFFRFHITAKDLKDQLRLTGMRGPSEYIDVSQWAFLSFSIAVELANYESTNPNETIKFGFSGNHLSAYLVDN